MPMVQPASDDYAERTRESFARQKIMAFLGAELTRVEPKRVEIGLPYKDGLSERHGFSRGRAPSTTADTAGGCALFTPYPAEASARTAAFRLNRLESVADGIAPLAAA